jgi:hypothetical protein
MPTDYTPSGSSRAFTVPAYADTVDGPTAFKSFADDVDGFLDTVQADVDALEGEVAAINTIATNAQASNYTLVLADAGKLVEMSGGGTLTVPLNSSVAFPVGSQILVLQTGASQVTVAGASTVTVNATPGLKLRTQWSMGTLIKRATDTWVLVGDVVA